MILLRSFQRKQPQGEYFDWFSSNLSGIFIFFLMLLPVVVVAICALKVQVVIAVMIMVGECYSAF